MDDLERLRADNARLLEENARLRAGGADLARVRALERAVRRARAHGQRLEAQLAALRGPLAFDERMHVESVRVLIMTFLDLRSMMCASLTSRRWAQTADGVAPVWTRALVEACAAARLPAVLSRPLGSFAQWSRSCKALARRRQGGEPDAIWHILVVGADDTGKTALVTALSRVCQDSLITHEPLLLPGTFRHNLDYVVGKVLVNSALVLDTKLRSLQELHEAEDVIAAQVARDPDMAARMVAGTTRVGVVALADSTRRETFEGVEQDVQALWVRSAGFARAESGSSSGSGSGLSSGDESEGDELRAGHLRLFNNMGAVALLVGSKPDLDGQRQVERRRADQFAAAHGLRYVEAKLTDGSPDGGAEGVLCAIAHEMAGVASPVPGARRRRRRPSRGAGRRLERSDSCVMS